MGYFNIDPDEIRMPPGEVRIVSLQAEPFPDSYRIQVRLQLTPFQNPPCLELSLFEMDGTEAGSVSIIEPPRWKHELIMHIRNKIPSSQKYILSARVFYPESEDLDKQTIEIEMPGTK